jgi:hypothetical protein
MIKSRYTWISIVAMTSVLCVVSQLAIGADEETLPEDMVVIAAIKTMFADPLSPRAIDAGKMVMDFSQGSDKVVVVVARDLGFYPGSEHADMLLAQYIAGVVKFDLENPKQASDERLGIQAGLQAALNAYKKIRAKEQSFTVAALDAAEASINKGLLSSFIGEALAKAKQDRITAK